MRNSLITGRRLLAGFVALAFCAGAFGGDVQGGSDGVWTNVSGAQGMRLTGPGGFAVTVDDTYYDGQLPAGVYRYEIYGPVRVVDNPYHVKLDMDNGRSIESKEERRTEGSGVIASGHFRIVGGQVYEPANLVEPSPGGDR